MKYLLAFAGPALIALCLAGFASAQAPPAAPTNVIVHPSGEGVTISWDAKDAAVHWIAWMNQGEYESAQAAGDWTTALNYAYVPTGNTYALSLERLIKDDDYWFIAGSASRRNPSAVSWGAWQLATAIVGLNDADEVLTHAYVTKAVAYYQANGRTATVAYYGSAESVADGRYLILLDDADGAILATSVLRAFPGGQSPLTDRFREIATEGGAWTEHQGFYLTGTSNDALTQGPMRSYVVRRDGLIFVSGHSVLTENVAAATRDYVNRAIAFYDENGLAATIERYNSVQLSLEGQFYLFLIGADDLYLAHPIFAHLIGTDIKNVVGSDGQRLGEEIAQATDAGVWVEYLWPHPVTRREQPKVTWAVRHDGLIFASGYYAGEPETGRPAWLDADPREYTMRFVHRAIELYDNHGLDSMLNYYNSVASFEGQWYLFATDADDIYIVHPLLPHLIGTDINDVVGSDGYELGKALAAAPDGGAGVWMDYDWPHPVTLQETPKISYAVRHDGILFASGHYEAPANAAVRTQEYVQKAIDYYLENGRAGAIARYASPESVEGQWSLTLADESDILIVAPSLPQFVGSPLAELTALDGQKIGEEMADATEQGLWITYVAPAPNASETVYAHAWAVRYEGLLFMSQYYDERPEVPAEAMTGN